MTTYKEIFGKPIKVLTGDPAPTPITYTVTVANPGSGNVYYIDGVQTPTLELYEGNTYNFDYSAATGHPFRFATAADAAGSTEYTTGVSVDSNITTIVVASGAPNLFYYCTNHNGMGGRALTPASPDEYTGQIWYNETTGKFRSVVAGGAWSSSGAYIGNQSYTAGFGTQLAGVLAGGDTGSGPPVCTNISAEYNGSGWATTGSLNTARRGLSAAGSSSQTAGVVFGGSDGSVPTQYAKTEEYNGTAWTNVTDMPANRNNFAGLGIQTAAVAFGAGPGPGVTSVEYDGTNWTAGGDLNVARASTSSGAGTLTAGLAAGGGPNPAVNGAVEHYNGTAWTAVTALPGVREKLGLVGTQTDALQSGGSTYPASPGIQNTSFSYNGTAWTAQANLGTGRYSHGTGGNGPANYVIGGRPLNSTTEEYNFTANTITAAAWSSGGALSTGRESLSSAGTQTAALAVGGRVGPPGASTAVESYNGTSMSGAPSLNTARQYAGGCGTQTSAITYGGGPPYITATEEYNGSSWATQPNSMSTARRAFASFGIQTAALAAGGTTGPAVSSLTEEYNGTSWTAGGALSQARQYFAGAGIETSGLVFGGSDNPNSTKYTNTEEYGGTSWTAGGSLPTGTSGLMGCGATQTAALVFGGYQPSKVATTVGYDGTVWSTRPSMGGTRAEGSGAGTDVAALSIGGSPNVTTVEEFTGETTGLNYKNISSS